MLDAFIIDEILRRERAERGIAPQLERPNLVPPHPPIAPRLPGGDDRDGDADGGEEMDRSERGSHEPPPRWDRDPPAPARGVIILGEDVEANDGRTILDM